jgi:NO-binding membrane sensor protein with MHYT domain
MNSVVTTSLDSGYVALSYLISVVGSFLALSAARQVVGPDGSIRGFPLLAAGAALGGVGVWSMHFVGMLALRSDLTIGYSMTETLVSLLAAVGATSLAIYFVAKHPTTTRVVTAGTVLGLGVCVMHYLGLYGMRFGGHFQWSYGLVLLSIAIAIAAAIAALWLAFHTGTWALRSAAALVMGLAVCAMHYTGMAAADLVCTTAYRGKLPRGFGVVSALQLPVLVTALALGVAALLAIHQIFRRSGAPTGPVAS